MQLNNVVGIRFVFMAYCSIVNFHLFCATVSLGIQTETDDRFKRHWPGFVYTFMTARVEGDNWWIPKAGN